MEVNFDPFDESLSVEEVLEIDNKANKSIADPTKPFFQFVAAGRITRKKDLILKGDGFEVLLAVRICGTHGLIMPDWLVSAYNGAFDRVLNCRANSWDEAFGKPYPGKHLSSLRKKRVLTPKVYCMVNDIKSKEPDTPTDKALFERVGKELNIGATLTEELYYSFWRDRNIFKNF